MNIMSNVTKGRKTKRRITERRKLQKVEKQKVENNKTQKNKCRKLLKVEKQLKHELFRYKLRILLTATCTVLYEKFPWAFLL